jgi:hypothetical protein
MSNETNETTILVLELTAMPVPTVSAELGEPVSVPERRIVLLGHAKPQAPTDDRGTTSFNRVTDR